jgi:hypothetical protein
MRHAPCAMRHAPCAMRHRLQGALAYAAHGWGVGWRSADIPGTQQCSTRAARACSLGRPACWCDVLQLLLVRLIQLLLPLLLLLLLLLWLPILLLLMVYFPLLLLMLLLFLLLYLPLLLLLLSLLGLPSRRRPTGVQASPHWSASLASLRRANIIAP